MNDELKVSPDVIKQAQDAFQSHEVAKSTDCFEVLKMPLGDLGHMSLILFKKGQDADPDKINGNLFIPVEIDGRKGYILATKAALAYGD